MWTFDEIAVEEKPLGIPHFREEPGSESLVLHAITYGVNRVFLPSYTMIGLMATDGSIVVVFVPPPNEEHPALAVLKQACMTGVLLLVGASLYGIGNLRARRQLVTLRSNAVG